MHKRHHLLICPFARVPFDLLSVRTRWLLTPSAIAINAASDITDRLKLLLIQAKILIDESKKQWNRTSHGIDGASLFSCPRVHQIFPGSKL